MYMWLWDYALALLLLACMLAICNHYNELDREEQEAKYKIQEDEEEGLGWTPPEDKPGTLDALLREIQNHKEAQEAKLS